MQRPRKSGVAHHRLLAIIARTNHRAVGRLRTRQVQPQMIRSMRSTTSPFMIRLIAVVAAFLALCGTGRATESRGVSGYYSHPDIHGDLIVFASEGDLWLVGVEGGTARRLTAGPAVEAYPRFSPDGRTIAYASEHDGNADVYTIPVEGGIPRRLTSHPYADLPSGWTPDGAGIIHFTAREHPHLDRETFVVPAEGGVPMKLPIGASSHASMAEDGRTVVFNRGFVQGRTWKRYGGGLADDVWIGDLDSGSFRRLTTYFGNDLSPVLAADRVFFTSERDGRMNLWSVTREGTDLRQHTRFSDFDVRFPGSDGSYRIVYQHGADIALYDARADESRTIPITLGSDRPRVRPWLAKASENLDDFALSDDGKKLLLATRGEIYNVPVGDSGVARPLTETPGTRETRVGIAGDEEQHAIFLSDRDGEYALRRVGVRDGSGDEVLVDESRGLDGHLQPLYAVSVAPDGVNVAFADHAGTLYWTNLTSGTLTRVDRSDLQGISDYEWSPDSRYLAYTKLMPNEYGRIHVFDTETTSSLAVTDDLYHSYSPTWDPAGKYLFFASARTFNRKGGAFEYEEVMVRADRLYGIILASDGRNPLRKPDPYDADPKDAEEEGKKKDGEAGPKPVAGGDANSTPTLAKAADATTTATATRKATPKKPKPVRIDFDGIAERTFVLPVESGEYNGLSAAENRLFFISSEEDPARLMYVDYTAAKPEAKVFANECRVYTMSRNRKHVVYRQKDRLAVAKTSADKAGSDDKSPRLGAIRLVANPLAEWQQMFLEVYRYNRDYFYVPSMAEVDWQEVWERYRPLVERVGTRRELTDLIGNVIGELGHGHTYVIGDGDQPSGVESVKTGLLGADFDTSAGLVRLARLYKGRGWRDDLRGPLGTVETAEVRDGWFLHAVNGRAIDDSVDPLSHFWGLSGQEVLLRLSPDGNDSHAREFRVTTIEDERPIRRRAWVESKRAYVAAKSQGRLGYMHLPDMGTPGMQSFFEEFFSQIDREAMVVDVRWNGGGNVSQMLIRRLNQRLYARMQARNFARVATYPARVFQGPMACLINQRTGSDGDIFARSFELFNLGPLIGNTTWGGVVGIRFQTRLMDGGMITVPEYSFIDLERGYGIENEGIHPTVGFEVDLDPADEVAGRDPQLDRAIEWLLAQLDERAAGKKNDAPPPPDRSTEAFRERSREWLDKP